MLRSALVLLFAIGQLIAPSASRLAGFGVPIDRVGGSGAPTPETPSPYAFAIWGVIFALALVFALRQAMPSRRDAALYQTVGLPALVTFAASCAWMLTAQFVGNGLALVTIIWVMFFAAARGFFRTLAQRGRLDGFDRFVTLPMFALYTGWLAAAVWLNTASFARLAGAVPPTLSPLLTATVVLLLIAGLSVWLLLRSNANVWLGATTLWALAAIAHANLVLRPQRDIATLAIGLALIVVAILIWQKRPATPKR